MKVLTVVGNRPQFIKSGPVSDALRAAGIEEVVLHTGQHWDDALSTVFYEELGLPEPGYRLDLHTADPEAMRPGIADALGRERPDWVIVYGDTNSTLAGAEGAIDAGVRVAHVEAGLRSGDLTMPEERNRIAVDRISTLLLTPDERSGDTLRANTEWVDTVRVGANTLVDPDDPSALGEVMANATFPADAPELYGDGHAAERVAASLAADV